MLPRRPFGGDNNATSASIYTWPTPDPEGPLVRPMAKLVTLLAATDTFRTRCGLETDDVNASEKLIDGLGEFQQRIFYPYVDVDDKGIADYPIAVVQWGTAFGEYPAGGGEINYTLPQGTLRLMVWDEDAKDGDMQLSLRDFGIFMGQLIDDLRSQFAYNDELAGHTLRAEVMPTMEPDDVRHARDPFRWQMSLLIDWGG